MPQNLGAFLVKKIEYRVKNAIDRTGSLCYTRTIEGQERQGTERHEKWRVKK